MNVSNGRNSFLIFLIYLHQLQSNMAQNSGETSSKWKLFKILQHLKDKGEKNHHTCIIPNNFVAREYDIPNAENVSSVYYVDTDLDQEYYNCYPNAQFDALHQLNYDALKSQAYVATTFEQPGKWHDRMEVHTEYDYYGDNIKVEHLGHDRVIVNQSDIYAVPLTLNEINK